ncbi:phage portal protein [Streptomyces sp. DH37]|uniref:phage portal protein n=1 Tax=Streptomyces sp. DH37 TaxID=3040122 RepID=UPI0024421EFF|nr:phage portal protein [Streptomyces sp. DH37]MDG9705553.1 phage portal protein [Streptomyces sp. DH37]
MADEKQAKALVELLEKELLNRCDDIDKHQAFYRGKQPLKFASDEFARYHGDRYEDFSDNWVQVVADSPVERLTVTGIKPAGMERADAELWRVWQANGLDADSQLGFLGAVIAARAFALVWGDPDDDDTPVVTFEDATSCIIAYEPGSRRRRRAALRRWQDGDKYMAVLYLPDEVWKFERPVERKAKSEDMAAVDEALNDWTPRDPEKLKEPNPQPNPMGVVPVVELLNRPMLVDDPISDVSGVIAMQNAVNLLWAQLFTASDYAAFPQRVVLGAEVPKIPILNAAGQIVGEKPMDMERLAADRVAFFTGDNASIGEWTAANLEAYTDVIEVAVGHIAAQTRTPQHYLIGRMANLSGDALIAAETGLVKRVEEKQTWYGQALRELFALVALARGEEEQAKVVRGGQLLWADAESRSHAQLADALLKLQQIGFPFEWLARRYGLTPTEVADVVLMRAREMEMDPVAAAAGMLARRPQNTAEGGEEDEPRGEEPEPAEGAA